MSRPPFWCFRLKWVFAVSLGWQKPPAELKLLLLKCVARIRTNVKTKSSLSCFPAAVSCRRYVRLLVHVVKLCSLNLHVRPYRRVCTCKRWAVPPILSPTWRLLRSQSQLWSFHQLAPQALWQESIMSASCSITVSHQQLNRCTQLSLAAQGWPGALQHQVCMWSQWSADPCSTLPHSSILRSTKPYLYLPIFFLSFLYNFF